MKQVGSRPQRTQSAPLSAKYNLEKTPLHAEGAEDQDQMSARTYYSLVALVVCAVACVVVSLSMIGWNYLSHLQSFWTKNLHL